MENNSESAKRVLDDSSMDLDAGAEGASLDNRFSKVLKVSDTAASVPSQEAAFLNSMEKMLGKMLTFGSEVEEPGNQKGYQRNPENTGETGEGYRSSSEQVGFIRKQNGKIGEEIEGLQSSFFECFDCIDGGSSCEGYMFWCAKD